MTNQLLINYECLKLIQLYNSVLGNKEALYYKMILLSRLYSKRQLSKARRLSRDAYSAKTSDKFQLSMEELKSENFFISLLQLPDDDY